MTGFPLADTIACQLTGTHCITAVGTNSGV